ncbi:hypothetical protein ACLOJK_005348 [Asimina triloba]
MSRNMSSSSASNNGPCGACKFLRRKCVSDCIFAPYFDSEQGAAHFGAVHKVFGASNVSKLLHRIPANKRLDAVVTICYEAQARLRDPVYGCVSHIFALQQQNGKKDLVLGARVRSWDETFQHESNNLFLSTKKICRGIVVNLQAELAYVQNHLSSFDHPRCHEILPGLTNLGPPSDHAVIFNTQQQQQQQSAEVFNSQDAFDLQSGTVDFQTLAQELLSIYFPGVRFPPSKSC